MLYSYFCNIHMYFEFKSKNRNFSIFGEFFCAMAQEITGHGIMFASLPSLHFSVFFAFVLGTLLVLSLGSWRFTEVDPSFGEEPHVK